MAPVSADTRDLHEGPDLLERVRRSLREVLPENRPAALEAWTVSLSGTQDLPNVVALLADAPEPEIRYLAARLAVGVAEPFQRSLRSALRRLLADRSLSESAQLALAAHLLSKTDDKRATAVLRALVKGRRKSQGVELMRRLEKQTGPLPAIEALCARYESKIKMSCPRCQERIPRLEMARHLWDQHKLLLIGRSLRRPWSVIEQWLEAYRRGGSAELLARCKMLAEHLDPHDGQRHFYRLLLMHHIDNAEARQALLAEAGRQRACLCPNCFALLPFSEEALVEPLRVGGGRIEGQGYRVQVNDDGLITSLKMSTPAGYYSETREPGQLFTARGAAVLLAAPFVVAAFFTALAFLLDEQSALPVVLCLLIGAVLMAVAGRLGWRPPTSPSSRAVDYAWTLLAPQLHAGGYQRQDSAFLAGLALASCGRGRAQTRSRELLRLLEITEQAVAVGSGSVAHLGALWHLAVEDAGSAGVDPIEFAVTQAMRCLEGKLPLVFAEQLFKPWDNRRLLPAQRARLCILLANAAFEAGCELRDLIDLGKTAPAFGAAMGTERLDYLAQLRLLWSLRPTRPWSACGVAATVFELAGSAPTAEQYFARHADLLLSLWDIPGGFLCSRGLLFHEVLFPEPPSTLEVKARSFLQGGGYELIVGQQRFWFQTDPAPLVVRLERWFRYYFREFRPRVAGVFGWPSQARLDPTRFHPLVKCPECRRKVQLRVGQVGIAAP